MRATYVLIALLALTAAAFAQESEEMVVDVNVVNIPITVTDSEGRAIVDLKKEDFQIFEDGQPVEIKYFTGSQEQEKKPRIRVGFLIDLSNTARLYYKNYRDSIGDLAFLMMPEGGDNEGFLMGYHTEVDVLVDYTRDPYLIMERMEKLKHGGGSSMLGAVHQACNEKLLSSPYQGIQEPRKFIVIVGDGHDNASTTSLQEAIHACQQQQVTIYAVSTEAWGFHEKQEATLHELARQTGGVVVQPMQKVHKDVAGYLSKPQDAGNYQYEVGTGLYARAALEALYRSILEVSSQVQSQYIIGYTPARAFTDSSYRKIDVKVNINSGLINVYARTGYFPPILE